MIHLRRQSIFGNVSMVRKREVVDLRIILKVFVFIFAIHLNIIIVKIHIILHREYQSDVTATHFPPTGSCFTKSKDRCKIWPMYEVISVGHRSTSTSSAWIDQQFAVILPDASHHQSPFHRLTLISVGRLLQKRIHNFPLHHHSTNFTRALTSGQTRYRSYPDFTIITTFT